MPDSYDPVMPDRIGHLGSEAGAEGLREKVVEAAEEEPEAAAVHQGAQDAVGGGGEPGRQGGQGRPGSRECQGVHLCEGVRAKGRELVEALAGLAGAAVPQHVVDKAEGVRVADGRKAGHGGGRDGRGEWRVRRSRLGGGRRIRSGARRGGGVDQGRQAAEVVQHGGLVAGAVVALAGVEDGGVVLEVVVEVHIDKGDPLYPGEEVQHEEAVFHVENGLEGEGGRIDDRAADEVVPHAPGEPGWRIAHVFQPRLHG